MRYAKWSFSSAEVSMSFTWRLQYRTAVWKTRRRRREPNGHVKIKCHSSYEATAHRTQLSDVIGLTSFTSCVYNFLQTSFCDVRKCDPNDRTTNKLRFALAKIHRSREDLAQVKTVNVVKNRWLPSLRSAAKTVSKAV